MGVYAGWLVDAARSTEFPVVEVAGWGNRGHGPLLSVNGVVGHHTATPSRIEGDYPSLHIVRDGRAGLAGPLCNLGLGRSGTIYVVAAGTAWHAGVSAYGGFTDLNDEFLGIEAESDGSGNWTAAQLTCYPRLVGELLRYMHRPLTRYVSHRSCAMPSGRKPDPTGIADDWMRAQAEKWLNRQIAPPPTSGETLRVGSRGDDVRTMQDKLNRRFPSYSHLAVDGIFGAQTKAVVEEFQHRWNVAPQNIPKLAVNGECDTATRRAIGW